MALTIVKRPLSGATAGLPIKINTTSTTSGLIHLVNSSSLITDEVFLFASLDQTQTEAMTMTLNINSQCYAVVVPRLSLNYPILSGYYIQGNTSASNGSRIEIYACATNNLHIGGYVHRVTES